MKHHLSFLIAASMFIAGCSDRAPQEAPREHTPAAFADHLSGAAFITADMDATLDFYTRLVGLVQPRPTRTLTGEKTLMLYGVSDGTAIPYTSLVPKGWPDAYPGHPGVNFAEIKGGDPLLVGGAKRAPRPGEPVLAFSVRNIDAKAEAMRAAGIEIVVPLDLSQTGRSEAITVLDPNGMRVQLYEMFQDPR